MISGAGAGGGGCPRTPSDLRSDKSSGFRLPTSDLLAFGRRAQDIPPTTYHLPPAGGTPHFAPLAAYPYPLTPEDRSIQGRGRHRLRAGRGSGLHPLP